MADTYSFGDYDFLRREAQSRVNRMRDTGKTGRQVKQVQNNTKTSRQQNIPPVSNDIKKDNSPAASSSPESPRVMSLVDIVMQDKERSLIILLILLLSQEKGNQGIILSLMYLLM